MHERRERSERPRVHLVLCRAHADLHADVVPLVGDGTSFVKVVDRRRMAKASRGHRDPLLPFGVECAGEASGTGDPAIGRVGN
jgi:hypothetical protein